MANFIDIGSCEVFDTDAKDVKRRTKKGEAYHGGTGTLNFRGQAVKVWVMITQGSRKGSLRVTLSEMPPRESPLTTTL